MSGDDDGGVERRTRAPHRAGMVVAALAVVGALVITLAACEPTGTPSSPPSSTPSRATPTTAAPPLTGCAGTGSTTTRDIRYASVPGVAPNLLSLDLTVPVRPGRCGPAPVVVWVHGGGFSIGDKANGMADKVRWATAQGWALASVNYRLSPRTTPPPPGRVMHPTHVSDIADAVAWLVANAPARTLDPDRILLAGHSAGAFLVALLATDLDHLTDAGVDPRRIRATAALDTRYDIVEEMAEGDGATEAMYRNVFGTDPAVWADASPQTHAAGPGVAPFIVVTRGQPARVASASRFAATLRSGGTTATLLDARPLTHEGVNDALGAPGDTVVTPAVTRAFRDALDRPMAQRR